MKEGISAEEFQKFIDGPSVPGFGFDALMNIYKSIDISLMEGKLLIKEFSQAIKLNLLKLR